MRFELVETDEQKALLAKAADEIWHEYWPPLIGQDQTDYMVDNFQSPTAIERDMREHAYEYWLLYASEEEGGTAGEGERLVGYTGGHVEPETNRFFISKIYLYKEERGKHYATATIAFYDELCRERGLRAMYLTVNKHNDLGIRAYTAKGFETIECVETDIGRGFIMDDYIMEKRVSLA